MADATYVFGAADAKISPLTADVTSAPTYGSAIDVPGLKSISISGSSDTKELRGDNKLIAKISTLQSVEVTLTFAMWDPSIYALLTGATLTPGTGDDYNVSLTASSTPAYFGLEAVSVGASGAGSNVSIFLPKLIITDLPDMVGLSEEDFKTVEVKCEALPSIANGKWIDWNYNETAEVL